MGIVFVIIRTEFIGTFDRGIGDFFGDTHIFDRSFHTEGTGRFNVNAHDIRLVLQNIIGCLSYDDAGFLVGKLPDDLALIFKKLVIGNEVLIPGDIASGFGKTGQKAGKAAGGFPDFFIYGSEDCFIQSA